MHRYHKLGKVAKKRHTVFRDDNGKIYHEELKGNKGFVGPSSLIYHIYPLDYMFDVFYEHDSILSLLISCVSKYSKNGS